MGPTDGTGSVTLPVPISPLGYLEGLVAIGPLQPVERVGVPSPTPSPAVCTARGLVVYQADTGAEALGSLGPDCHYSVALPPGNYWVELDRRGIDFTKDLPRVVTITAGQTTRLDINVDTGIR
jgi:hypothetical protein